MSKEARGSVKYRLLEMGVRVPGGHAFQRSTAHDRGSSSGRGRTVRKDGHALEKPPRTARRVSRTVTSSRSPSAVRRRALCASAQPPGGDDYFKHRESLGFNSNDGAYRTHIQPVLDKPWEDISPEYCERLRDALDAKALEGKASPKTMFNAWTVFTTAAKAGARQWKKHKAKKLRVRTDNPCLGIAPPDIDDAKELQWIYPNELLKLLSCALVPLEARRLYALAVYLFARAGELKALDFSDVDIERGIVSIRVACDRDTNEIKQTKTGNKGIRRFAIEPNLLPLLRVMHAEANGTGPVVTMRQQKWWATDLRKHLEAAQIKRAALFRNDATSKRLRFHDFRGPGLTWMAIRGDEPLKIQQRAGHTTFDMTQKYIRTAEAVGEAIGDVFPPLPACLQNAKGQLNCPKEPQVAILLWRRRELKPGPRLSYSLTSSPDSE